MKSLGALLAGSNRFTADSDTCGSRIAVAASTLRSRRRDGVFQVEDIVSARRLFMYKPALLESLFFYLSARKGLNALCSQVIATEPKR